MRILRYDLTAFGPFTGLSLDLAAPGVHMIFGPNEAGKSTALHALGQLLYGIDERTPYDFVHAKRDLRLGALMRRADGTTVEFVRVKSRKTPLVAPDGQPIDPAALSAALGGIGRQTFTTEFAISSTELREGGRTLVAGRGELGQALAASASGLRLTRTREAIEARMGELYKPRGSTKPAINVKIRQLKEIRGRMRAESLRPDDYLNREREVEDARRELVRMNGELSELRLTYSRLERLDQALPQLTRRRQLLAEIDTIEAEGVLAPQAVAERFPHLMQELRQAQQQAQKAGSRLESIDRNLAELVIDEALLEHADEIEALSQDRKAVQEAAKLLERSAGEAARLRAEATELLAQVHPGASLDDERLYRIPEALRERAQELSRDRTAIGATLEDSQQARSTRRRRLEEAQQQIEELAPVPDSEPLRSALVAVPQDLLTRMSTAQETVRKHQKRAASFRTKLRLPEEVAPQVPSREEVDSHRRAVEQVASGRRSLCERVEELAGRLAEQRLDLASLLDHDPPPTRKDLEEARARRDELWAGLPATEQDYLQAVGRADEIADRMFHDAERVNRVRELQATIGKDERKLARLNEQLEDLNSQELGLESTWQRLWEGYAGIVPQPEAAVETLDLVHRLQETLQEVGDAEATAEVLAGQAVQHAVRLRELLGNPAEAVAENVLSELPELCERAEAALTEWRDAADEHASARDRLAAEQRELDEAEAAVTRRERQLAGWAAEWWRLLDEAGLPADREPVGALADLDRLDKVAGNITEADQIERQAEQAERQVAQFHDELDRIAGLCGQDVPPDHAERYRLVPRLHADAKHHRTRAGERDGLHRRRDELAGERDEADQAIARLQAEQAELIRRTGVDSAEELDASVRRRDRHIDCSAKLTELTQTIALGSQSLDELMEKARLTDPARLKAELSGLKERIDDLDALRAQQQDLFTEKKTGLDRLDGSANAAQAAAEAEALGAALIEEAEEYLRLEIARKILLDSAETYLNAQQDPVLKRAGHLFRELTRGGFSGLELDQERDVPVIAARRGTRELLHVHQLSEATADQLYLALRLASLERYADEDRALPFTIDDIFMTFDNARTQAALKVLDELADRFQMIVFTHHNHLPDLARRALPSGRLHVHALPEFRPTDQ